MIANKTRSMGITALMISATFLGGQIVSAHPGARTTSNSGDDQRCRNYISQCCAGAGLNCDNWTYTNQTVAQLPRDICSTWNNSTCKPGNDYVSLCLAAANKVPKPTQKGGYDVKQYAESIINAACDAPTNQCWKDCSNES